MMHYHVKERSNLQDKEYTWMHLLSKHTIQLDNPYTDLVDLRVAPLHHHHHHHDQKTILYLWHGKYPKLKLVDVDLFRHQRHHL
jgi:hypothetical protein